MTKPYSRPARFLLRCLLTFAVLGGGMSAQEGVSYSVTLNPATPGRFQVRMEIADGKSGPLEVRIPAWTFGEYVLNSAWENIEDIQAEDAKGTRISIDNAGNRAWRALRSGTGTVVLTWTVTGLRPIADVRGYSTETGVLLEGAKTFLYVKGGRRLPCSVVINAPGVWSVASSLAPAGQPHTYLSAGYDDLADAVIVAGAFREEKIVAGGLEHSVVVERQGGAASMKTVRIRDGLKPLIDTSVKLFGPAPYKRFLFVFVAGDDKRLAHRDAAVIGMGRIEQSLPEKEVIRKSAIAYLETWNGKRFRPKELGPFEFEKENRTRSLWMSEGVTEYLATILLRRSGRVSLGRTLIDLTQLILDHRNHHLSEIISPEDASWEIWDRDGDESLGIDPSMQGALLGLLLDIRLRQASEGKRGLPDLVRLGLERYGKFTGYTSDELVKLAGDVAGSPQSPFFEDHVRAAKALPWDATLPLAGLEFNWFKWKVKDPKLRGVMSGSLLVVGPLEETSQLHVAGLRPGDELMYINQKKVKTPDDVDRVLATLKPGQKLRLDIRHNKKHRTIRLSLEDDVTLVIPVELKNGLIFIKSVPPGPMADAGIKVGDQLEKIDKRRIIRETDVPECLRRVRKGRVLLRIKRAGKRMLIKVKAPRRFYWRGSLRVDPKAKEDAQAILKSMLGDA